MAETPENPPSASEPNAPANIPIARPVFLPAMDGVPMARKPQVMPMPMSRLRALLEALLLIPATIAGGVLTVVVLQQFGIQDARWFNLLSSIGMGLVALVLIMLLLRWDGHSGRTIGWTAENFEKNILIGLGTFLATFMAVLLVSGILTLMFPHLLEEPSTAHKAIREAFPQIRILHLVPVLFLVSVWEEVAFRGFLLTRLHSLLRRWWLTILVGAALFGAVHSYQGALAMGLVFVLGLILGVLMVWRKSLVPGIFFHFANNLVMMLIVQSVPAD